MADRDLVEALAECLEAMRMGETELKSCLERYSEHREELEALLAVAQQIPRLAEDVAPSPTFRERARRELVREGNGNGAPPASPEWQGGPA
ncbi:MAG: hypothetical protein WBD55_07135 [Dehalococcoidia bacterium]